MRFIFIPVFLLVSLFSFSQDSLPEAYFINPLKIPISLSGSFGELRDNHFHSGLDIRTQQRIGLDVHASAPGYISRLKTGPFGYGNVLYIQHPNGYTTVYAHMEEFAPKIREYVRKRQYELKKHEIELYPQAHELPVDQGEFIGLSGNSGSSGGPHLHFEIRDAAQRPLNPFLFGMQTRDSKPPQVRGVFVYPQQEDAHANLSAQQQELHLTKIADGSYQAKTVEAFGELGFGINAMDYMDDSNFTHGIYQIQTCLNGEPQLEITFDQFSFANTRYINQYIDYYHYRDKKARIQKLFIEENNKVDMSIKMTQNKGLVNIKDSLDYKYEIYLKDFAGNLTYVKIPIRGMQADLEEIKPKPDKTTDFLAFADKPNVFDLEKYDVFVPKDALYEDTFLKLEEVSGGIQVHEFTTPLHKNITIGFNAEQYNKEDFEKLYVARVLPWGKKYYSDTYKEENRISTRTRIFGFYKLEMDTTPPTIVPVNFRDKKWVSELKYLNLRIKDEESGIADYHATINGEFIVMEYDYKTGILRYDFRDKVSNQTENNLKVIVVDNVGNSATFEAVFYRKE